MKLHFRHRFFPRRRLRCMGSGPIHPQTAPHGRSRRFRRIGWFGCTQQASAADAKSIPRLICRTAAAAKLHTSRSCGCGRRCRATQRIPAADAEAISRLIDCTASVTNHVCASAAGIRIQRHAAGDAEPIFTVIHRASSRAFSAALHTHA